MSTRSKTKWEWPPVHPAAEKFPRISLEEQKGLADSIAKNGLQHPIIFYRDNREAANGSEGPFGLWLLDGRERRDALALLGITDPNQAPSGKIVGSRVRILDAIEEVAAFGGNGKTSWRVNVDPELFVTSMNLDRRHLTPEQRRQAAVDLLKAYPNASDREIGRKVGISHPTVARVRKEAGQNGNSFQIDANRPGERVRAALLANPGLTGPEAKEALGVAESTLRTVRKKMVEAGEIPDLPRQRGGATKPRLTVVPDPKPKAEPKPKPSADEKAAARKAAKVTDDVSGLAVLAKDLREQVARVVKHQLTDEQTEAVRRIRAEIAEALRLLP